MESESGRASFRRDNPAQSRRRSKKFIALVVIILLLTFLVASTRFNLESHLMFPDFVEPVVVELSGVPVGHISEVALTSSATGMPERIAARSPMSCHWSIRGLLITQLYLHVSNRVLPEIRLLRLQIGSRERTFTSEEIQKMTEVDPEPWCLPEARQNAESMKTIQLPKLSPLFAINMPGNLIWQAAVPGLLIVLTLVAVYLWLRLRVRTRSLSSLISLLLNGASPQEEKTSYAPLVIGLLVTILGLALVYTIEPYPFTQDDNFTQFLPVMIRSCETMFAGNFPVWNPYQLLGTPTATVGYYALTYPPLYLCYAVSHYICHNDLLLLEFFAWLHLLAGYFATYWALRQLPVSQVVAATGSFTWVLSGWFLVAGRSQYNFLPYCLFLPLAIAAINRFATRKVGWMWMVATGSLIGAVFHAGHAEYWFYTLVFCGLSTVLLFIARKIAVRRLLWMFAAILLGTGIAAPLLIPQRIETLLVRRTGEAWNADFLHMLLPLGGIGGGAGQFPGSNGFVSEMYYCGGVFLFIALSTALVWGIGTLLNYRLITRKRIGQNVWLICGAVAFVLALGPSAVAWNLLHLVPPFNLFRWSIKFVPFMNIFWVCAASLLLERLFKGSVRWRTYLMGALAACMLMHVLLCRSALYTFADRTYPPLVAYDEVTKEPTRVYTVVPSISPAPHFVESLGHDFATMYKVLSFNGYDWVGSGQPEHWKALERMFANPLQAGKAYGIGLVIRSTFADQPVLSENPVLPLLECIDTGQCYLGWTLANGGTPVKTTDTLQFYEIKDADPIVFANIPDGLPARSPKRHLSYALDQCGIHVKIAGLPTGTSVTANFLNAPWMVALVDGRPTDLTSDQWHRIQVTLQAPGDRLDIRYEPPWEQFLRAGLSLIAMALILGAAAHRLNAGATGSMKNQNEFALVGRKT